MAKSRTEGLERFRQKALQQFPQAARDGMREANDKTADEFIGLIRRIIPKGDDKAPELISTLEKRPGDAQFGGLGVVVSIGGPEAPYPMHLEDGHRAADGTHVPAKPFWRPAKRVVNRKHKGRAQRAQRKAIKAIVGGGSGG